MVNQTNKNHFINSLQRVSKMLKPLLRRFSKRARSAQVDHTPAARVDADFSAENAANEALEARLRVQGAAMTSLVLLTPATVHCHPCAPDRDLWYCSPSSLTSCGAQTPEQQSPSPRSVQLSEHEDWW